MTETMAKLVDEPQILITYRAIFTAKGGHEMTFQAHLPATASDEQFNHLTDKLVRVVDRQHAASEWKRAEIDKAVHLKRLEGLERQFAEVEEISKARWEQEGRKGNWTPAKLTPQDQLAYGAIKQSMQKYREGLLACEDDIARYKPLVNGHASDSGANRQSG